MVLEEGGEVRLAALEEAADVEGKGAGERDEYDEEDGGQRLAMIQVLRASSCMGRPRV
jgi:hypothetical protein